MPSRKHSEIRAGLYVRISQDRAGDELGVERQREDCQKLAQRNGWAITEVYADDDRSAYSGKPRPSYDRMLDALERGELQAVVAWHPDRLHRSPTELERFIDVVNGARAQVATVQAGELDLSTASGRMTARVVGAVARHESEQKSERLRRQREQMALQGRPHGGRRAFGYDPSGSEIVDAEATLIREAVERVLAGESLRAVCFDWNARGVRSTLGKEWSVSSLRCVLTGPRVAGLRVHRGEVIGDGTWPAILERAEHERLVAALGNPRARLRGRPPVSLLARVLACGICGGPMRSSKRKNGSRRYLCESGPGRPGCGRVAIAAVRTEEIVVEVVLARLDTPALTQALAEPSGKLPASDEASIEKRLAELADLFGDGEITKAEWMRARKKLEKRLADVRARRDDEALASVLRRSGNLPDLRNEWPKLTTDQQRAVLAAVIDQVVVAPAAKTGYEPGERLSIEWRA